LNFEVEIPGEYRIDIYNSNGQLQENIFSGYLSNDNHSFKIEGSYWSQGMYFCKIENSTGETQSLKLTKI